ncbi:MAG: serine/threonine-protein phosphatase [Proteobacteria bacterium]|nr:serine/threonine-protein phosphatase [Pseudomonadota bacterium]
MTTASASSDLESGPEALRRLEAEVAELGAENARLSEYRRSNEEEEKRAKEMLDRMTEIDPSLAGHVSSWMGPASRFSGDIVLAERTPSGSVVAFLGDVTGHGLAAAFISVPVIRTFTAMTRKGFSLGAIAAELNAAAFANLRRDQFIAGTLALFDPDSGMVEVWNGGNPAALLVDEDCRLQARFRSEHLPLGVLAPADFDPRTKAFLVEVPCQLALVSDGITEQRDASGRRVGELGVLDLLKSTALPARLAALRSKYTEIPDREDDCSVLLLDCAAGGGRSLAEGIAASPPLPAPAEAGGGRLDPAWELTLKLGVDALRRADIVPLVSHVVANLQPPGHDPGRLHVVLAELFNNALDHGLLQLDSRLKDSPDGFQIWMDKREARLNRLSEGTIELSIAAGAVAGKGERFHVRISDSGGGFDPDAVGAATGLAHGRGIALVRSLADSLEYHAGGAAAEVVCAP